MIDPSYFGLQEFPPNNKMNQGFVYEGLGSFWTQIFQERNTLKGYTMGMVEELIQQYYNLIDVLNSFSTKDLAVFHRENWYPLVIKKSEFNQAPLTFNPDDAVFGAQPETDPFFHGKIFQFGKPKTPADKVYLYRPVSSFKGVPVVANRVLSPSLILVEGVSYIYQDGNLYFNVDLFNNPYIPHVMLLGENGVNIQYTDSNGVLQNDEMIVLWGYGSKEDREYLYYNSGYVFDVKRPSSQEYKEFLKASLSLYVDGPTIQNIQSIAATFLSIKSVVEAEETVEEVFEDSYHKYVVTDLTVYKFDKTQTIRSDVQPGLVVYAGEILVDSIVYYDNVLFPKWWLNKWRNKISISQNIFLGSYKQQLLLSNFPSPLSVDVDGNIHFPIEGLPEDVEEFHNNLDQPAIKTAMGLTDGSIIMINPVDFMFENFFKNNVAFLKFELTSSTMIEQFFSLMEFSKNLVPKHVYFIVALDFNLLQQLYDRLNQSIQVLYSSSWVTLNADGSDVVGYISPDVPDEALANPGNVPIFLKNKLFTLGKAPELDQVLVKCNSSSGGDLQIKAGKCTTSIPSGATTKQVHNLQLIDFS